MGDLSWRFDERERKYIAEVLDSGFASATTGSMNSRFEEAFAIDDIARVQEISEAYSLDKFLGLW